MRECQQVVARTNKECVGIHQTTSSGCDVAPVIEMPCWKTHEVDNTKKHDDICIRKGGS